MPQFSGYNSRFGGAPAGAARNPAAGGYPSRTTNKGRPAQPSPMQPQPPPQYPSPIQGPPATPMPDPYQPAPPGNGTPTQPPGIEPWMGQPLPSPGGPMVPPNEGPPGPISSNPTIPPNEGSPGLVQGPDNRSPQTPENGWYTQPFQPPQIPPGSRPWIPQPGLGGLSDTNRGALLMQLLQRRRAAAEARRNNPYGPGRDLAGYPIPPPGMMGPV